MRCPNCDYSENYKEQFISVLSHSFKCPDCQCEVKVKSFWGEVFDWLVEFAALPLLIFSYFFLDFSFVLFMFLFLLFFFGWFWISRREILRGIREWKEP